MSNADEPAFPNGLYNPTTSFGLTKRELFAAMAMQGRATNSDVTPGESLGAWSVRAADALLKALEH